MWWVQAMLQQAGRDDVAVEIVFPVSPEAITTDKQGTSTVQVGICSLAWLSSSG